MSPESLIHSLSPPRNVCLVLLQRCCCCPICRSLLWGCLLPRPREPHHVLHHRQPLLTSQPCHIRVLQREVYAQTLYRRRPNPLREILHQHLADVRCVLGTDGHQPVVDRFGVVLEVVASRASSLANAIDVQRGMRRVMILVRRHLEGEGVVSVEELEGFVSQLAGGAGDGGLACGHEVGVCILPLVPVAAVAAIDADRLWAGNNQAVDLVAQLAYSDQLVYRIRCSKVHCLRGRSKRWRARTPLRANSCFLVSSQHRSPCVRQEVVSYRRLTLLTMPSEAPVATALMMEWLVYGYSLCRMSAIQW